MYLPLRQPGSVALRGLIPSASFVGCAEITVSSVAAHSDDCTPGCLFATLPGTRHHGRDFIPQALQRGAAAILTDFPLANVSLPQCIVQDVPTAYGQICHGMYGHPSRQMRVAGVTGTNGKTTTTWILRSLLQSASRPTGLLGTIEYSDGVSSEPSQLTTPDAMTMARYLAAMRDRGTRYAAIELSSHALDQSRCAGLGLDVAVITNVTHDHLDYHKDFDRYLHAKASIVKSLKPGGSLVLNADDPHLEQLLPASERRIQTLTFGQSIESDISIEILSLKSSGSRFRLNYGVERLDCQTPLIGQHNVSNCVAAACAAIHLGLMPEEIVRGLAELPTIPGRLEAVECGQEFQVFVDYAHTDDAITRALHALRPLTPGRLILVFGAGGDRDPSKRPAMGRAATQADLAILTSDNPRRESPEKIVQDILTGFDQSSSIPVVELNRRAAIEKAIQSAVPGDTILIAGKGHEKSQILGDQRVSFDDVAVSREALIRQMCESMESFPTAG